MSYESEELYRIFVYRDLGSINNEDPIYGAYYLCPANTKDHSVIILDDGSVRELLNCIIQFLGHKRKLNSQI